MSRRYFDEHGRRLFQVGDLVTQGDGDVHVVTEAGDVITMRCVKEPGIFPGAEEPWCRVDDIESNLASRYHYAEPEIESLEPPLDLPENVRKELSDKLAKNTMLAILFAGILPTPEERDAAMSEVMDKSLDKYVRINGGRS